MKPAPGAKLISRIVDPDAKPCYPAMIAFENELGGRVAISAIDLQRSYGRPFNHPHRAQQYHSVVRWLACGRPPDRFATSVSQWVSASASDGAASACK